MRSNTNLLILMRRKTVLLVALLTATLTLTTYESRAQCNDNCTEMWIPCPFSFVLPDGCIIEVAAMMRECDANSGNWQVFFHEALLVDLCTDCEIPEEIDVVAAIKDQIWNKNVLHFPPDGSINLRMLWPDCWQDDDVDNAWGCTTECCIRMMNNWFPGGQGNSAGTMNQCAPPCVYVCD